MNALRRLIPDSLRAFDLFLQENHPRLWATRWHYHLWFLLLVNVLILALGFIIRVDPRHFPDPEELFGYMILPAVVYFCFWTYKAVLFTVERRFGERHFYAEVSEFFAHFVSILLVLTIPYNLALTATYRIASVTEDEDFVHEVNVLNEQACWFYGKQFSYVPENDGAPSTTVGREDAYSSDAEELMRHAQMEVYGHPVMGGGTHEFFRDVQEFERSLQHNRGSVYAERPLHSIYEEYVEAYNRTSNASNSDQYDPGSAAYNLSQIDSIEKRFPLLFTSIGMFTPYGDPNELHFKSDSLLELEYFTNYRSGAKADRAALSEAMAIARKYSTYARSLSPDTIVAEFTSRRSSTANLHTADGQITKLARAKYLSYHFARWEFLLYAVLLPCFVLALLISIFKNIYWQPFLIALVCSALLPILILIFALLTEHTLFHIRDERIMLWCYYLIFLSLIMASFAVPQARAYRTRLAVMTILANVIVPFIAVFTVFLLDEEFDVFRTRALSSSLSWPTVITGTDEYYHLQQLLREAQERTEFFIKAAFWGGLAVYVFVLHAVFRNLYTRLMALPERK